VRKDRTEKEGDARSDTRIQEREELAAKVAEAVLSCWSNGLEKK